VEFFYQELGSSSINFLVRFWVDAVKNKQNLQAQSDAILAIKKAFDANDINIPFPIRTLEFNNQLQMDVTAARDEE
jgi:small conductance mechanosensitive channel